MGASGKMDAKIPPVAGELSLRFRLRPAVRVLASYSVVSVTAVANRSFLCTRTDHIGEPEQFWAMVRARIGNLSGKYFLHVRKIFISVNSECIVNR
jgi:hypothetical protein